MRRTAFVVGWLLAALVAGAAARNCDGVRGVGFSNQRFVATSVPDAPFLFSSPVPGGPPVGFVPDLINELLVLAGCNNSIVWTQPADGFFGTFNSTTGASTGTIADVLSGAAELILAPLTITSERMRAVRFMQPFYADSLGLLINAQPSFQYSPLAFMQPFTAGLWTLVFLGTYLFGVVIWQLDLRSPFGYHRQYLDTEEANKYSLTMRNATENAIMSLFGAGGMPVRQWSGRIFAIAFYFYAFIITASYLANLTANLFNSSIEYDINSLAEAIDAGATVLVINASAPLQLVTAAYPAVAGLLQTCNNASACISLLEADPSAVFVYDTASLLYAANSPPCASLSLGPSILPQFYAFASAYNWTYAADFDYLVTYLLRETNTIQQLTNKWFLVDACKTTAPPQQIDIPQLAGIWYMMLIFIGSGLVVLGVEWLVSLREDWTGLQAFLGGRERLLDRVRETRRKSARISQQIKPPVDAADRDDVESTHRQASEQ